MTRIQTINSAAGHLQTALMLYVDARREDRTVRDGLERIIELAGAAEASTDPALLKRHLADIAAAAATSLKCCGGAGTRLDEVSAAIGSMRDCLESRAAAPAQSAH